MRPLAMSLPVHVLSFHADYACRHSTACCTAPWGVAIDEGRAGRVERAIVAGALSVPGAPDATWLVESMEAGLAPGLRLLRREHAGACVFLCRDDGQCAIHRACGHDALPEACQQFPRVTLVDERGAHVTLSHYCPTVASLTLIGPDAPVSIVTPPAGFTRAPLVAGLDARGQWPPLLRPGVLCSPVAWSAWETWVVHQFANAPHDPDVTLAVVARAADRIREWRTVDGEQERFVDRTLAGADAAPLPGRPPLDPAMEWRATWSAVPGGRASMPPLDTTSPRWRHALDEAGNEVHAHGRAVGRYLAARAFASWCAYQGLGLRTHVASVRASLGVLLVELARALRPTRVGETLDARAGARPPLARAMRQADWLLVHLAESASLARLWSSRE